MLSKLIDAAGLLTLSAGTHLLTDHVTSGHVTIVLQRDAVLQMTCNVRQSLEKQLTIRLVEPGAKAKVRTNIQVAGTDVVKFKTFQHHEAPDTQSALEIRGVLFDGARLWCDNLIRIDKDAQRVVASEQNKNLLLGPDARVTTIPKMEVFADDVSCQHGAAISRLDGEHLHYLQSRGLSPKEAKNLLITGFLR